MPLKTQIADGAPMLIAKDEATKTCVSVVMPIRNEELFIDSALRSLQQQATPNFDLEILAVDGMSEDGTSAKIGALAAADPRIKLLRNPSRHTPAALNVGLRAASGEYVCIMGAHASYDPDYIAVCLGELLAHKAVGCSGKVVTAPADSSLQARLVAWAAGHPFASSSRSVRTQPEGFADTVPFPVVRREALIHAGGYNEQLLRNQDNDMNQRLRAMGLRLYVTGKTSCRYYARPNVRSFLNYGFRSGYWNALSLRQNARSLGLRHLAPLAFVTTLSLLLAVFLAGVIAQLGLAGYAGLGLAAILATHLGAGTVAGIQVGLREGSAAGLCLGPVILAFHCSYGVGTLRGLMSSSGLPAAAREPLRESSSDPI